MARQLKAPQIRRIIREASRQSEKYGIDFPSNLESKLKRLKVGELKEIHAKELRQKYGTIEAQSGEQKNAQTWFRERQNARRRERRAEQRESRRQGTPGQPSPSVTDIVLQNIEALIDQNYGSAIEARDYGSKYLKQALNEQIRMYGRSKVAKGCEESASQAWRTAEAVIYESNQNAKRQNLMAFIQMITGVALSADEAKAIEEYTEQDESYEVDDED